MKKHYNTTLLIFLFVPFLCLADKGRIYNVADFGARPDSLFLNTVPIQKAIDKCAVDGGGTVVIPKGAYVSGSVFLKKNVSLKIDKDGVLKGSVHPEDYPQIPTRWEGEEKEWTACLINAIGLDNIKLTGPGTIDGSGDVWTAKPRGTLKQGKPRLIGFQNCTHVEISGLRLKNQACWGLFVLYCVDVEINNLIIRAEHNIPSSDGIDIDSGNKIHISDCDIDVNDDCISIKSGKDEDGLRVNKPCENILIEKCRFGYGHGGVAMGSETSGGIRNVMVQDCMADSGNWAPIRFKSQPSRGGVVENISFKNLKLNGTRKAFEFNMAWRMVKPKPAAAVLPIVRNVVISNVNGIVGEIGDIRGLPKSPINGVMFIDCNLSAKKGLLIEDAINVDTKGLKISGVAGEMITTRNTVEQ